MGKTLLKKLAGKKNRLTILLLDLVHQSQIYIKFVDYYAVDIYYVVKLPKPGNEEHSPAFGAFIQVTDTIETI